MEGSVTSRSKRGGGRLTNPWSSIVDRDHRASVTHGGSPRVPEAFMRRFRAASRRTLPEMIDARSGDEYHWKTHSKDSELLQPLLVLSKRYLVLGPSSPVSHDSLAWPSVDASMQRAKEHVLQGLDIRHQICAAASWRSNRKEMGGREDVKRTVLKRSHEDGVHESPKPHHRAV
jgi:hypothetical protein